MGAEEHAEDAREEVVQGLVGRPGQALVQENVRKGEAGGATAAAAAAAAPCAAAATALHSMPPGNVDQQVRLHARTKGGLAVSKVVEFNAQGFISQQEAPNNVNKTLVKPAIALGALQTAVLEAGRKLLWENVVSKGLVSKHVVNEGLCARAVKGQQGLPEKGRSARKPRAPVVGEPSCAGKVRNLNHLSPLKAVRHWGRAPHHGIHAGQQALQASKELRQAGGRERLLLYFREHCAINKQGQAVGEVHTPLG